MRRRCYYALVIFLIIIVFLPFFEGVVFKKQYFNLINLINQDNRINMTVMEYDEGWFHSYAKVHITLNQNLANFYQYAALKKYPTTTSPIDFTIEENISHGPIIYDKITKKIEFGNAKIQNDFYLSPQTETSLFQNKKIEPILQFEILSEFDGDWSGKIHIPALSFPIQEIGQLSWDGLNGNFKLVLQNNQFKHARSEILFGAIKLQGYAKNSYINQISITPVKYRYNVTKKAGLLSGFTNTYTPKIDITMTDKENLTIEKFAVHTAFSMDQETLYNTNISINAKNIKTSNPIIPTISTFHFMLIASNFSAQGLGNYVNELNANNQTQIKNLDLKKMEGLLVHTITPTSIFHGNIMLNTPLGALTGYYKSSWKPNVPAPNTFLDIIASANTKLNFIISPSVMAKLIELYDGHVTITNTPQGSFATFKRQPAKPLLLQGNMNNKITNPQPAYETPQQIIDELMLGGLIDKDKNNNYISTILIESGIWKMNGIPVYSQ